MKSTLLPLLLLGAGLGLSRPAAAQSTITVASYLGAAADDDKVVGTRLQANGELVVAANLGSARPGGQVGTLLNGAAATAGGAVLRLGADGKLLSVSRVAAAVYDLALDAAGNIYVAAGPAGLLKLDPTAGTLRWARLAGSHVQRVDAGAQGTCAALVPSSIASADDNAGAGQLTVFDKDGAQLGQFGGYQNTQDLCLDEASQTLMTIGWRQANAFDGTKTQPVQIAYLRGHGYTGTLKWNGYDWSTDQNSPRFINRPTNNMADTRGYRCSLGRDGKLYAAFECAGGNHIFRYSTTDITLKQAIVGGDKYHEFFNTASEHKTFFGRYEPATGVYLRGQQLVNRLSSGKGNAIRVKGGEIRADETGRVYLGGAAAFGLPPLNPNPAGLGDYTGGAWLMVLSADFSQRLVVTRLNAGGQTAATDARLVGGSTSFAWGGAAKIADGQYLLNAVQPAPGGGTFDGFVALASLGGTVTGTATPAALATGLRVWPNPAPAGTELTVQWPAAQAGPALLTVADALGRQVRQLPVRVPAAGGAVRGSVAGLAPGLYRVSFWQGQQQASAALAVGE